MEEQDASIFIVFGLLFIFFYVFKAYFDQYMEKRHAIKMQDLINTKKVSIPVLFRLASNKKPKTESLDQVDSLHNIQEGLESTEKLGEAYKEPIISNYSTQPLEFNKIIPHWLFSFLFIVFIFFIITFLMRLVFNINIWNEIRNIGSEGKMFLSIMTGLKYILTLIFFYYVYRFDVKSIKNNSLAPEKKNTDSQVNENVEQQLDNVEDIKTS